MQFHPRMTLLALFVCIVSDTANCLVLEQWVVLKHHTRLTPATAILTRSNPVIAERKQSLTGTTHWAELFPSPNFAANTPAVDDGELGKLATTYTSCKLTTTMLAACSTKVEGTTCPGGSSPYNCCGS